MNERAKSASEVTAAARLTEQTFIKLGVALKLEEHMKIMSPEL